MTRSLISMTSIKRLAASINHAQKVQNNEQLIKAQGGNIKELPPKYAVQSVEFNPETRITRIEFLQSQQYRTIERYITQNYVKYPVFSEWKIRNKTIKKSIKLTNSLLETLNIHEDELIRLFAEEIILSLNNEELMPSWFIKNYLIREKNELLQKNSITFNNFKMTKENEISNCNKSIEEHDLILSKLNKRLKKINKKCQKKELIIKNIEEATPSLIKSIFTLGIYTYLISNKRKTKILNSITLLQIKNDNLQKVIDDESLIIQNNKHSIDTFKKDIASKRKECEQQINEIKITYAQKISEVTPLVDYIQEDADFIPLKMFSGIEYEKIIGCYIIHNKEKDKYYVGQSKDVLKRLKQHFKGTIPLNPIFAEDYYTSAYDDKSLLFEIKIIKCDTKDELDNTERQLIYDYDSWNNGYNGTSGNI